ncbi:MAG: flagellar hook-length control protein FliK [Porcipelethomonas sp.]
MENVQMTSSLRELQAVQCAAGMACDAGMSGLLGSGGSFADIILQMICNTVTGGETDDDQTVLASEYANMLNFFMPSFMQNEAGLSQTSDAEITDVLSEITANNAYMLNFIPQDSSEISEFLSSFNIKNADPVMEDTAAAAQTAYDTNVISEKDFSDGEVLKSAEQTVNVNEQNIVQDKNFTVLNNTSENKINVHNDVVTEKNINGQIDIPEKIVSAQSSVPENNRKMYNDFKTNESVVNNSKGFENQNIEVLKSVVRSDKNSEPDTMEFYGRENLDFLRTVNELKNKNVSSDDEEDTMQMPDLESLQINAETFDVRRNLISAMSNERTETVEAPSKQLLDGIEKNIESGRDEFTVKLKPEGLGEIIVKLVMDDGGKMLMSMTASSAKTAELINRDIAMLQSSLNQHNVEIVNQAQTEQVVPMNSVFEQYYGDSRDGNMPNQYNPQRNRFAYSHSDSSMISDETEEENLKIASGLDIIV